MGKATIFMNKEPLELFKLRIFLIKLILNIFLNNQIFLLVFFFRKKK